MSEDYISSNYKNFTIASSSVMHDKSSIDNEVYAPKNISTEAIRFIENMKKHSQIVDSSFYKNCKIDVFDPHTVYRKVYFIEEKKSEKKILRDVVVVISNCQRKRQSQLS
jgi:hypothetical protein